MLTTDSASGSAHFRKAHEAATTALASQPGTTRDISADIALGATLDAYGIPSEFWPTGGGCTARYVSFAPMGDVSESAPYIVITDDASADHPVAEHNGWLATWYGPEFDGIPDRELYSSAMALQNPTLADMAHDSASCARAIREWYDGATTQWTRNDVSLEAISGPYRCQTRPEHWDGYCAPRFPHDVMQQICADTQTAHRAGRWNAPAHFEGQTVVIVTSSGRTEIPPDKDGFYRTGAFHWPWTEYTDRATAPVTELVEAIQWTYERQPDSWTVIIADHGWRVKVIDVLPTLSPGAAPQVTDALRSTLNEASLSSYKVSAKGPGEAAAAVRAHFATARSQYDPDTATGALTEIRLPDSRP